MKQIYIIILWMMQGIVCTTEAYGQEDAQAIFRKQVKNRLHIGDTLPLKVLESLQQNMVGKSHEAKPLILCLWATWCGSSMSAVKKMESLQTKFGHEFQFLLINTERRSTVDSFVFRSSLYQDFRFSLPRIQLDDYLDSLFKTSSYPHFVWLNKNGKILAITDINEITEENMYSLLKDSLNALVEKTDLKLPWDYREPLFANYNGGNGEEILQHSVISAYVEGLPSGSWVSTNDSDGYTILAMNLPVKDLYQLAYNDDSTIELMSLGINSNRTMFMINDSLELVGTIKDKWVRQNTYTYQLICQKTSFHRLKQIMQDDLDRYFGLHAKMVKRKRECIIVKADTSKIRTKGGRIIKKDDPYSGIVMNNISFGWFKRTIADYASLPLLDETGFKGNIDLVIEGNITDFNELQNKLNKSGINLSFSRRKMDVLLIKR